MRAKFALIAEYVSITQEGKLNIMGVLDRIFSREFPTRHPNLFLVAMLEAGVVEGTNHILEVSFVGDDGEKVIERGTEVPISLGPGEPGHPLAAQVLASFPNLALPHEGDFEFHLHVDGNLVATVPLYVRRIRQS